MGKFWQNLKRSTKLLSISFFANWRIHKTKNHTTKPPELLICQLQLCIKDVSLIWHCKLGVQKYFVSLNRQLGTYWEEPYFPKALSQVPVREFLTGQQEIEMSKTLMKKKAFLLLHFPHLFWIFKVFLLATCLCRCSCSSCKGHHNLLTSSMYRPKCPVCIDEPEQDDCSLKYRANDREWKEEN